MGMTNRLDETVTQVAELIRQTADKGAQIATANLIQGWDEWDPGDDEFEERFHRWVRWEAVRKAWETTPEAGSPFPVVDLRDHSLTTLPADHPLTTASDGD